MTSISLKYGLSGICIVTAAASFLPTDLTVMPEWYKADAGVTLGTGVQSWADQGTNGNNLIQLTGSLQPAHDATGGFLSFDGIDDFMENTSLPMSGSDVHVFIVAALYPTATAWSRFIDWTSASNDWAFADRPILLLQSNATTKVSSFASAALAERAITNGAEIDGVFKLIRSSVETGVSKIAINKIVQTITGALTPPLTGAGLSLGKGGGVAGKMDVKEIIYVRGAMTAQEIIDTENYLQTRHGL